jgi:prepilin-type N-terminal cleavage/methylation domain-containing protein
MKNCGDRQRGVSLIEVLIALFILSVIGVTILAGAYVNIKSTETSRENIRAEGLAKYELEYVKSVATNNWNGIINQVMPYTIPSAQGPLWDPTHDGSDLPDIYSGYTVTITISVLPGYDSNIRKVNAAVYYQGNVESSIDTYVMNSQ